MANTSLPPVMGWSSWNHFRQNINEDVIYQVAQAMKDSGLAAAGYQYVNLDDCWQSSARDDNGHLQFDLSSFPSGKELIDRIHRLGLRVGLYSSCGPLTCEDMPASYDTEYRDARTFVDLGADFLKYDYCHVVDLTTDEKLLSTAPAVVGLEIRSRETNTFLELPAANAQLSGAAQLTHFTDESPAITGLSAHGGEAQFTGLNLPAGEYVVTVIYHKFKSENRQLLVVHAAGQEHTMLFPTTSGWSATGRVQIKINAAQPITAFTLLNPITDRKSDAILRYRTMASALQTATKSSDRTTPFIYSVCEHGRNAPWTWAPKFADAYRISGDIRNNWASVVDCYDKLKAMLPYAVPGSYADPDMLEVGNGALTQNENIAHFSLWAFLAAPLILGNDIRHYQDLPKEQDWLRIVTNKAVIAIDQEAPHLPAEPLPGTSNIDVLAKYMADGQAVLCIFNRSDNEQSFSLDLAQLPAAIHGVPYQYHGQPVTELWQQTNYRQEQSQIHTTLPAHAVNVFALAK